MKIFREAIKVESTGMRPTFHQITAQVKDFVKRTGVKDGICVVYSHHTTCSVTTQEDSIDMAYTGLDYMSQDLVDIFDNIIPTCRHEGVYMHPGPRATAFAADHGEDSKGVINTDAHLRSSIMGRSESIIIMDGEMDLGDFAHIYFIDFDCTRARTRTVQVQIIGE